MIPMRPVAWTSVLLLALPLACGRCTAEQGIAPAAGSGGLPSSERASLEGEIAFISERDGNPEVYLIRPDGTGEYRLTTLPSSDFPESLLPDGRLLVISVREEAQTHLEQLFAYELGDFSHGRARREVPLGPASAKARPGGITGEAVIVESAARGFSALARWPLDGGAPAPLTDNPEGNFEPEVSPDGSAVIFSSSRDGDSEIYRMNARGGEVTRLTAFQGDDWAPHWIEGGRRVVFLSD